MLSPLAPLHKHFPLVSWQFAAQTAAPVGTSLTSVDTIIRASLGPTHVDLTCAFVDLSTAPGAVHKVPTGQLCPLPLCIPSACDTPGTKLVFKKLGEGEEKGKRGKK